MLQRLFLAALTLLALAFSCAAQNANTSTTTKSSRPARQTQPAPQPTPQGNANTQTGNSDVQSTRTRRAGGTGGAASTSDPTSKGVQAAFDNIVSGIEQADVELVTGAYWNSPQLTLFNFNGTVTRGWEQMRKNRESSYPNMKDTKLTVKDKRVLMVGRDAALVTCQWTQTQTYKGTPETASGRMTLVFQRVGGQWKAIHLHTSPDAPDPSRLPASEQTTEQPKTKQ
jgi:ketosteroid isomerase-like protein